jgi:hypothetical protein
MPRSPRLASRNPRRVDELGQALGLLDRRARRRLLVDVRVDLIVGDNVEELDEADVAERIKDGDTTSLLEARALDGMLRIGDFEIFDELVPVVHRLCFDAVITLTPDGAVFDYSYFSSNESLRLVATGDTVVLSGGDLPETTFSRRELLVALHACGARWLATLDQLGRTGEANPSVPISSETAHPWISLNRWAENGPRSRAQTFSSF